MKYNDITKRKIKRREKCKAETMIFYLGNGEVQISVAVDD